MSRCGGIKLIIYTDGACSGNPGPGGFGFVVLDDDENIIYTYGKRCKETTNNREELKAIIMAMLHEGKSEEPFPQVYTDSAYCYNTLTTWMFTWAKNDWKKSNKKQPENIDLIKFYYKWWQKGKRIDLHLIRGHAGNKGNMLADALATGKISKDEVRKLYGNNLQNYKFDKW